MSTQWHPFERALMVSRVEAEIELRGIAGVPWADFLLNPRRLRGSDFLMGWSQGVWSEERIVQAVNATGSYFALPYGLSAVAPDRDVREFELYFERLDRAGLRDLKRPDILIFTEARAERVRSVVKEIGGEPELPFTPEDDERMAFLLSEAILAVECENSLWRAKAMPDYGRPLRPVKRLGGKLGLPKAAVVPTIIIKDEDRAPLRLWQVQRKVPLHVWHVFYVAAFGLALDKAEELIRDGLIQAREQVFQAPGGATTRKVIYSFYYHYAYLLGDCEEEPRLAAAHIEDKNGHILPYVRFEGGRLALRPEAMAALEEAAMRKQG
ncbi:MAG TPA: AccI family restriction endonuclease [Planctomycetota bacterium]|nr:AccI family restriction endonuclease [Planctomycetota bacterium]HRR80365.1 AccI family restriction endonuclease [Planctomycetota bacterium]HRT94161.1 AccI family restriction endonuclease [Planctomycetota bacterium]